MGGIFFFDLKGLRNSAVLLTAFFVEFETLRSEPVIAPDPLGMRSSFGRLGRSFDLRPESESRILVDVFFLANGLRLGNLNPSQAFDVLDAKSRQKIETMIGTLRLVMIRSPF